MDTLDNGEGEGRQRELELPFAADQLVGAGPAQALFAYSTVQVQVADILSTLNPSIRQSVNVLVCRFVGRSVSRSSIFFCRLHC
jgi:hypothetical protein